MVTFMIDLTGHGYDFSWTGTNTHFTTFAPLNVDDDNSSDFSHLVDILIYLAHDISATKLLINDEISQQRKFNCYLINNLYLI